VFADTLHTVFCTIFLYDKVIIHFNDDQSVQYSTWLFETYPALVGIISASVQLFFVWRVKVLTKNLWLSGLIALLSLMQIAGGLAYAVEAGIVHMFSNFLRFRPVIIAWLATSALCDILITISITWALRKHRAKPLILAEDMVKRITRLTLQNGLITTIWTVTDLLIVVSSSDGAHFIFCFTLAKLYINSLFSTLNARPIVREPVNASYMNHSRLVSTDSWDGFRGSMSYGSNSRHKATSSLDDLGSMAKMYTPMSPLPQSLVARQHNAGHQTVEGRPITIADLLPSPPPSSLQNEFPRN